ncbi:MAG: PKD domain-containing protein [Chitinophagales bacterium]|nr:PKD domain-containing protein [Chitinophagales bacterium]
MLKREFIVLTFLLFISVSFSFGQNIVFSENFSGTTIPSSFLLIKNDTGTVSPDVSDFTDPWIIIDIGSSRMAASTSWYTDNGNGVPQSDNWMITPKMSISQLATVKWDARALDPQFPDGYELWVLDGVGITNPTAADFLNNGSMVFSVQDPPAGTGESSTWISRSIDLFNFGFSNTDVFIAWRNNSTDKYILAVDNIEVIDYFNIDSRLSSIISPTANSCKLETSESITVEIQNLGTDPLTSVPVSYSLDLGAPITETATFSPALNTFETGTYTFTNPIDLSMDELYSLDCWTELNADGNIRNDSLVKIIGSADTVVLDAMDYTTGFELFDFSDLKSWAWTFDNLDGGGDGFGIFEANFAKNGSFVLSANSNTLQSENDWAYSTCVRLTAGIPYSINYYHRTGVLSNGDPIQENFQIGIGNNPDTMGMIVLGSDSVASQDYERYAVSFQPATTDIYYVGINRTTDPSAGPGSPFLYIIDDFKIEDLVAPTAAFSVIVGSQDSSVSITNNSLGDGNSYLWEWGDGDTSILASPDFYQYGDTGFYQVCLTASNFAGSDQTCQTIKIEAVTLPQADFISSLNGLEITVTDDSKGSVNSWAWDFGDGTTAVGPGPIVHTYTEMEAFEVCLTVSNIKGSDTHCDTIVLTSIEDIITENNRLKIYPNPANDEFYLSLELPFMESLTIEFIDIKGRRIYSELIQVLGKHHTMYDCSKLEAGLYTIRVHSNKGYYSEGKVVIF